MLFNWSNKLETVHVAVTPEEREAIYRFRYQVYVRELNQPNFPGVDHARERVMHEEDELPFTTLLYTGTPAKMTGSGRICVWGANQVPEKYFKLYSMGRLPNIERYRIAILGNFVTDPALQGQGKLTLLSLLCYGYEMMAGTLSVDIAFFTAYPGILRQYLRLGASPFGGNICHVGGYAEIPLVNILSDFSHFKRVGSPLAPLVKKFFGPGLRQPIDITPFKQVVHLTHGYDNTLKTESAQIWEEIHGLIDNTKATPAFFGGLSDKAVKMLTESGLIITLNEGDEIIREGSREKEVFVILKGAFEVLIHQKRIAVRAEGELIGEIAFFTGSGERTATVRALTVAKLLVLRHKFLMELNEKDPSAGYQILMNMARILAGRLADNVQIISSLEQSETI